MKSAQCLKQCVACLAGLILFIPPMSARDQEQEKILFLHLRIKGEVVTLLKCSTRPGVLKKPHHQKGELTLDLISADGAALWTTVMEDPRIQRFEYEDPDNPGQLKTKVVQLPETEFMVRVPYKKAAKRLVIFRHEPVSGDAPGKAAKVARRDLGNFDLPLDELK